MGKALVYPTTSTFRLTTTSILYTMGMGGCGKGVVGKIIAEKLLAKFDGILTNIKV